MNANPSAFPTGIGLGLRHEFLAEADRTGLSPDVAFLEVSPENYVGRGGSSHTHIRNLAERFRFVTHGLSLGVGNSEPLDARYVDELREFIVLLKCPWHSEHLCFSELGAAALHELLPVARTTATLRRISERINELQDRLGVPIAVENISYYMETGEAEFDEVDFLRELVNLSGCKLLLDLNNIHVNAQNYGFDPYRWLERAPLDAVVQLHVAGGEYNSEHGVVIDTHGSKASSEVRSLMQWVVERTGPLPVLLERDQSIPPLPLLLKEVSELTDCYNTALSRHARRD